jgi:hypothetical protein
MTKKIIPIRAETINRNRNKWFLTHAISMAEKASKDWGRSIYRLPNGVYAIRDKRVK